MELSHFFAWAIAISLVAGLATGIMLWAYRGSGSTAILFTALVPLSSSLEGDRAGNKARDYFQQGCEAFGQGKYRQGCDRFTRAIQQVEDFPEAYHNRGITWANLRQDDDAVVNLLRASDLYGERGNMAAIAQIKQQLEAIKVRKLAREQQTTRQS
jgi:Flp pilus assembly protein TadD